MNESSHFTGTGQARRLIATIVIGTAAAAVTAGVALNEHPPADAVVERGATAGKSIAHAVAPAPARTRREPWRDPWQPSAPPPRDPSLPAAEKALEGVADPSSSAPAPTF